MSTIERAPTGPFYDEVIDAGFKSDYGKIRTLKANPDIILRERDLQLDQHRPERPRTVAKAIGQMAYFKSMVVDLQTKYGIHNPGIHHLVAEDPKGRKTGWLVTRRVHGCNVYTDMAQVPKATAVDTMASLIRYYYDAAKGTDDYIADLSLGQCVFGRLVKNQTPKAYLVDLDENVTCYYPGDNADLGLYVDTLVRELNGMERIYGHAIPELHGPLEQLAVRLSS